MGRRFLRLGLILTIVLAGTTAVAQTFGAVLTGPQEDPATTSPGWGNFTGTFDALRANLTVTLTVANLGSPINGFHIHEKASGQLSGPIIINFPGLGGTFINNKMTGTFPVASDVAARMIANPSNFYVNVHTNQFTSGAIRGDLAIAGTVITYAADLRGSNEVPPNSSTAFGSAFITIDTVSNTLSWEINETGIASPTLSHIHGQAAAGGNASVLISFATSPAAFTGGRLTGSVSISGLTPDTINALYTNPANFYVNVHSTAFPNGEIRGQLTPANEYDVAIAGRVTNGLGQTFVTDVRVFNPSYDTSATALLEFFQASSTPNASASRSLPVSIAPRGTAVLDDVNGANLLNNSGTGAIRVSGAESLAVTSRIYADLRNSGKGTLGQFAAGAPRANALRRGTMPQLANQSDLSGGYRTNIGFFNPTNDVVTVRLELRSSTGSLVGTDLLSLQPLSQQQNSLASYFNGVDLSTATNLTMTFDASAPIVAYASVVDNVSTDQIFVYAQPDPGVATLP
jgi:CHRD domain